MARVAPSERFRDELDEVLAGAGQEQDPVETIGRLGARLILQQALEDEVSEFLGRRRYERTEETVSHRNGYEPRTVRTTSGPVDLQRPRVRDASKLGFESRILGRHVTRTWALESLVISSFVRGLSVRDVEAVLEDTFEQPVSSRSTVSRILEDTRERYRRWCRRRLDQHDLVYLFLDALVRHEALLVRAGCETPLLGCHSSLVKLRAARPWSCRDRVGAALTTTRRAGTVGPCVRG